MAATIIPRVYTYYISTALFAIFGLKMLYDGWNMTAGAANEELEEVQSDLKKREEEVRGLLRRDLHRISDFLNKIKNIKRMVFSVAQNVQGRQGGADGHG